MTQNHEIQSLRTVVLLQPTSPLRTAAYIDAALTLAESSGASGCVSVCKAVQSRYRMYRLDGEGRLTPLIEPPVAMSRRQDIPPVYVPNGAIYVARVDWLRQTRNFLGADCIAYLMSAERSLAIDTLEDFEQFSPIVCSRQGEDELDDYERQTAPPHDPLRQRWSLQ